MVPSASFQANAGIVSLGHGLWSFIFKITFRCVPHKEGREIGRFWWLRTEPGEGKVLCLDKTPGTPHSSTQHKELLPECWCLLQIRCYYSQWETIWYFHWSCKLRSKFDHCAVMDCSHVLFSWRYQRTGSINHYQSKMVWFWFLRNLSVIIWLRSRAKISILIWMLWSQASNWVCRLTTMPELRRDFVVNKLGYAM